MGQFDLTHGARVHLVEKPADVATLAVTDPDRLAYVTQTTLSVDDTAVIIQTLRERFPKITGPRKDDICYATQNRQDAVRGLARECEVVLVVGSTNSSNSNRLRELAALQGAKAYLIDGAEDIEPAWLTDCAVVGVTAGASAPDVLVRDVVQRLQDLGGKTTTELPGREETITFSLPRVLVQNDA